MARTRDLLVVVIAVVLGLIGAGMFLTGKVESPNTVLSEEVTLSAPRDVYELAPPDMNTQKDERNAFMQKVRNSYVPVPAPLDTQEVVRESVSTTSQSLPVDGGEESFSSATATATYGDASF